MSIPMWGIDKLMGMHPLTIRLRLCMQACRCQHSTCRICSRRCMLSMTDGCELLYPVLGSDNQLYDALHLRDYALWCRNRDQPCVVLPDMTITHVYLYHKHTLRRLISKYMSTVGLGCTRLLRHILTPRTEDASTQTDVASLHANRPLHAVEEVHAWWMASPRRPHPVHPRRSHHCRKRNDVEPRGRESFHPFPRSIYEHSPRAVSLFCVRRVSETA